MTDGPRLTIREMKRRDWWLLGESLPREETCNALQRSLKWFAWGEGWLGGDCLPSGKSGRKYLRQIWNGLAGGPYRVGPFQVERSGRWGIVFALDPAYAVQRAPRRRRGRFGTDAGVGKRSRVGGWDGMFQRLHDEEIGRRFTAIAAGDSE